MGWGIISKSMADGSSDSKSRRVKFGPVFSAETK